jgi:hypothetical protein
MRYLALFTLALMLSGCCMMARQKSSSCAGTYPGAVGSSLADSCGNCPPAVPQSWDCRDSYTCPDFVTNRMTR